MYNHDVQNTIQLLKISIMVRQSDQQYMQGQYRTELDNDKSCTSFVNNFTDIVTTTK